MSTFGQVIKALGSFGSPQIQGSTGAPPFYPLDFYNHTTLGLPFYHFRSDWEGFYDKQGGKAKVGDKVKTWKNTYLPENLGDAVVPPDTMNGGNYWGKDGYPTLVERNYGSTKYKGLQFTGTEYFEIDGGTVTQAFNLPHPIFSTGGTNLMTPPYTRTGASFLFVVHSDMDEPVTNPTVDGLQSLLYSRPPNPHPPGYGPPPGYTWPTNVEDYGAQIWFQGWTTQLGPQFATPAIGPVIGTLDTTTGYFPKRHKINPNPPPWPNPCDQWCGEGNGAEVIFQGGINTPPGLVTTRCPPASSQGGGGAQGAKVIDGFQILLFEFDNTTKTKRRMQTGPGLCSAANPNLCVDVFGPLARYYTFGNSTYEQMIFAQMPGMSNSLSHPRQCSAYPGAPNRILFDSMVAFLGGMPPCPAITWGTAPQAHGFRGTIFEVMMFEGLLSRGDRKHLEAVFTKKYQAAIT